MSVAGRCYHYLVQNSGKGSDREGVEVVISGFVFTFQVTDE